MGYLRIVYGVIILTAMSAMVLLSGCAVGPHQLGLSRQAWLQLDSQQKQAYRDRYKKQHHYFVNQARYDDHSGQALSVSFIKGYAMMPPFDKSYLLKPTAIIMQPGSCRLLPLASLYNRPKKHRISLALCYRQHVLSLDPSYTQPDLKQGSLFINAHPAWQQGITYSNLSSRGYVRLKQTDIRVKLLS